MSTAEIAYSLVGVLGFVFGAAIGYILGYGHGWHNTVKWYQKHLLKNLSPSDEEESDVLE